MAYRQTELTRRNAADKRVGLLRAARELVAAGGFAAATVAAIAARGGVSVGSVYSHFENRDGLLAEVFRSAAGHEIEVVRSAVATAPAARPGSTASAARPNSTASAARPGSTAAAAPEGGRTAVRRLGVVVDVFGSRALRGRRMAWALLFEPVSPVVEAERLAYRRSYTELIEEIVRDGVTTGEFVPQDTGLAASAAMGAVSEALVGWLRTDAPEPSPRARAAVVDGIRQFCFRALGSTETT